MNARYIFASDADWDERAELLVRNLKGTQLLPAVLFDVAEAPMRRQMQLYFAGSGNATRKQTGGKNPKPVPAVVKVLERLGAELDRAKADKSYRIAVACGNRTKQVKWVQDLAEDMDLLWSLRQYHGHSGADVKDYDFRQAVGFDVIGVGDKDHDAATCGTPVHFKDPADGFDPVTETLLQDDSRDDYKMVYELMDHEADG